MITRQRVSVFGYENTKKDIDHEGGILWGSSLLLSFATDSSIACPVINGIITERALLALRLNVHFSGDHSPARIDIWV